MNGLLRHDKLVQSLERELRQWRTLAIVGLIICAFLAWVAIAGGGR